jgi:Flp pilus assembly protein TadG
MKTDNTVKKDQNFNSQRGGIVALFAIAFVPLLLALGLVIDSVRIYSSSLEQEANAEQAATAALREIIKLRDIEGSNNPSLLTSASTIAKRVANLNTYLASKNAGSGGTEGTGAVVKFGRWDVGFRESTNVAEINSVSIILRSQLDNRLTSTFMKLVGIDLLRSSRKATVYFDDTRAYYDKKNPYILVKE